MTDAEMAEMQRLVLEQRARLDVLENFVTLGFLKASPVLAALLEDAFRKVAARELPESTETARHALADEYAGKLADIQGRWLDNHLTALIANEEA